MKKLSILKFKRNLKKELKNAPLIITNGGKPAYIVLDYASVTHEADEALEFVYGKGNPPVMKGLDAIIDDGTTEIRLPDVENNFNRSTYPILPMEHGARITDLHAQPNHLVNVGFGTMDEKYRITPLTDTEGKPNKTFWQQVKSVLTKKVF